MGITTVKVSRALRAWAVASALALAAILAGCAPKTQPGDPLPGLKRSERARFDRGKEVFEREFTPETGLGPLFNSTSCGQCHEEPKIGGFGDEIEVHATAYHARGAGSGVRGAAAQGSVPYEASCDRLTDQGGPVVQQHVTPALHDALGIEEEPVPPRASATGRRTTPSILGFGLLDAVPDEAILAYADPDDRDHDGVSGRPNRFTDGRLGRFGRKAFVPTLAEFNAGAFLNEQGITSPAQPFEETIGGKPVPPGVDLVPEPELSQQDLDLATDFVRFLAPPARWAAGLDVLGGGRLFAAEGDVAAYTDLLLHDMGPDLADICLGLAAPSEFRTEPLMGLRLRTRFLHDGRAVSIEEAIRLHGGEGTAARDRFNALPAGERREILKFLGSL